MPALRRSSYRPHPKPLTRRRVAEPEVAARPRTAFDTQRQAILDALATCPHSAAELTALLGRKSLPREAMEALASEGLIVCSGRGPGARYRLTEHGRANGPRC